MATMPETPDRKSLLCRLGWHDWYTDSAVFSHAKRCNRCREYENQDAAEQLQFERRMWTVFGKSHYGVMEAMVAYWNEQHGTHI
jgi:hypothetical protein